MPGRLSRAVPSPQFTEMEETVPSGSVAVKLTVTDCPTKGEGGVMEVIVTTGGRSFTTSVVVPDPGPALFVAVTVITENHFPGVARRSQRELQAMRALKRVVSW